MNRPTTPVRRTDWPAGAEAPLATPLAPAAAYTTAGPDALDDIYEGRAAGYIYARECHPNATVLARKIDALEGLGQGVVTASGMAAIAAATLGTVPAGARVVAGAQLYGRSQRLLREELPRLGIEVAWADPTDGAGIAAEIAGGCAMVLVELVSNPTLRVADMPAIAAAAQAAGATLVLDNTFATPLGAKAGDLGADVVVHSVTKLLAGHSDVTLGYVAARDATLQARIETFAITLGLTPSPFDCWLAERGLQTFELRHARACATAAALADALAAAPAVSGVLYPGRSDHPDHALAAELLGPPWGNMVCFHLSGGRPAVDRFLQAADGRLPFAATLGDVATTLAHPASSSHRALSVEGRAVLGIGEGTLRVSVGVEATDYVLEAFAHALAAV